MKPEEIRSLSPEDLNQKLNEAYRELFNLRFRLATRQLNNSSELSKVRKDIARMQTIIRERGLGIR